MILSSFQDKKQKNVTEVKQQVSEFQNLNVRANNRLYLEAVFNWNDRRSRRVFLCFYSAIF